MQDTKVPAESRARRSRAVEEKRWRKLFLAHLAATSNVTASAKAAGVSTSRAYDARRSDPGFYRQWQEALCEGYEHLEMALLQRLREGEIKPASGAKRGTRVFDNATTLRLLTVHRDSASRQQAIRDNRDSGVILERINARIDRLRVPVVLEAAVEAGGEATMLTQDDANG
ncbi:hypothetical protein ABVV53_06130 [Novosphingobium sp. RD2P27]|uniref:Terminase small subunit n=1 Tax=Novosphingobium kalidii TaxID=3230299 RepID=A0ABV2CZL5_9SPHN